MRALSGMRRLHSSLLQAPQLLFADYLWDKLYTGTGVKVCRAFSYTPIDDRGTHSSTHLSS